jgi:hypothetical protein
LSTPQLTTNVGNGFGDVSLSVGEAEAELHVLNDFKFLLNWHEKVGQASCLSAEERECLATRVRKERIILSDRPYVNYIINDI